jgi:hypothetical protein
MTARLTPSEKRLNRLCRIRDRSLTEQEAAEVIRLSKHVRQSKGRQPYFTAYRRERYANDPVFREAEKARVAAYKARKRAEVRA